MTTNTMKNWQKIILQKIDKKIILQKRARYEFLASDIKDAGSSCMNLPFEIGSQGHVILSNNKHKFVQKVARKNVLLISFKFSINISSVH